MPKKGCQHTEEAKRKMSEAHLGRKLSEETKRKMSLANKGKVIPTEQRRRMSESHRGHPVSVETRRKMRENHRCRPRRCSYKDIHFRSSWESKCAGYLDTAGVKWEYEPHVFTLIIDNKETTYRPDFYLPEFGIYYEVKGWTRPGLDNRAKVLAAREQHGLNITVFDYKLLRRLGII